MSNDITSKNGLITVPFDNVTKCWVAGYIDHLGHTATERCIDLDALERAHNARLTKSSVIAQRWANRAEKVLGGLL